MTARLWIEGEAISVRCSEAGRPLGFTWREQSYRVRRVCNRWRASEEWWRAEPAAWREYIKLVTEEGLLCLIAWDIADDRWFLIRVFD